MRAEPDKPNSPGQWYLEVISGQARGLGPALARAAGIGLGAIYAAMIRLRNAAYDRGLFRQRRAARPVISVGNLSAGGTGKTVLVAELARWLTHGERPVRVAILMRGYRAERTPGGSDEAAMLRQMLPGVTVEPDPDRLAAAQRLLARPDPPDVFLLDDGFQHRRLARDLDIVTVDATMDLAGPLARVLPAGLLREPIAALARADCIVVTRCDQVAPATLDRLTRQIREAAAGRPILRCRHAPRQLRFENSQRPLEHLAGKRFVAFCGIGNPEAFRRTAQQLPGQCVDFVAFEDHHAYREADLTLLADRAGEFSAELFITTSKDYVKLTDPRLPAQPNMRAVFCGLCAAVEVELEWLDQPDTLRRAIDALVRHPAPTAEPTRTP